MRWRRHDAIDKQIAAGVTPAQKPLLGVPIGNQGRARGKKSTAQLRPPKILGKFISPYDGTVIEKLKAAGPSFLDG